MTVAQLALMPLDPSPDRGAPLLAIRIPVEPRTAARARAGMTRGRKPRAVMFTDSKYAAWQRMVVALLRNHWRGREALVVPVIAKVCHVHRRPAKRPAHLQIKGLQLAYPFQWTGERVLMAGKRDLDNLNKAVLDVLVESGILLDDGLVVEDGGSRKVYAAIGEDPSVEVRLWRA